MSRARHVLIVAGEASGDAHAAKLVKGMRAEDPGLRFSGIAGPRMREAGVETLIDASQMAVVGLVEVLAHFRFIYGALQRMRRALREERPDLLILVDYPDFNLRLAKTAKELGIKVLYYISPQVWAWRKGRVKKIAQRIDMMAVVLPFEAEFYEQANVPVRFVGHPLTDVMASQPDQSQARRRFALGDDDPVIGLFPGSRRSELKRLLPVILDSAKLLKQRFPRVRFMLPLASTLTDADIRPQLDASGLEVAVVENDSHGVMRACDAVVTASGTATLEIALAGTPMVIIYKVAPLSYALLSRILTIEHIGLCNIVAGQRLVPELIQHEASPTRIADELARMLYDAPYRERIRAGLAQVEGKLRGPGGSTKVASLAMELLGEAPAATKQTATA